MKEVLRTIGGQTGQQGGGVVVGSLKKTSVRINSRGDVIDPATKQIIKRNEELDVEPK